MMLVRACENKEKLVHFKNDLIELLNPLKSDKFKPVREAVCECLNQVRTIPDILSHRERINMATFSPNNGHMS